MLDVKYYQALAKICINDRKSRNHVCAAAMCRFVFFFCGVNCRCLSLLFRFERRMQGADSTTFSVFFILFYHCGDFILIYID